MVDAEALMALVSPVQMLGLSMLGCRKAGLVVPRASDTETPQALADAAVRKEYRYKHRVDFKLPRMSSY